MICSASSLRSSGLRGCMSSPASSPLTRMVGGRPTLRCRSEPFRCTIWEMACLKLNGATGSRRGRLSHWDPPGKARCRTRPVKNLPADFPHHAGDLGLDLVHDLHRFDDADRLPGGDPAANLDIRLGARLRRPVEGAHHGRLDLLERGGGRSGGRGTRRGGGWSRCAASASASPSGPIPERRDCRSG